MSFPNLVYRYLLDLDESSTLEDDVAAMPLPLLFALFIGFLIWLYLFEPQDHKLRHRQYVHRGSSEKRSELVQAQYVQTVPYPPRQILKLPHQKNNQIPQNSQARSISATKLADLLQKHVAVNPPKSIESVSLPPPPLPAPPVQQTRITSPPAILVPQAPTPPTIPVPQVSSSPIQRIPSPPSVAGPQNPSKVSKSEVKSASFNTTLVQNIPDVISNNNREKAQSLPKKRQFIETSSDEFYLGRPPEPIIPPVTKSIFDYSAHHEKANQAKPIKPREPKQKHKIAIAFNSSIQQVEPPPRIPRTQTGYLYNPSLSDNGSSNELFFHEANSSDYISLNASDNIISRPSRDLLQESLAERRAQNQTPPKPKKGKGRNKNSKK